MKKLRDAAREKGGLAHLVAKTKERLLDSVNYPDFLNEFSVLALFHTSQCNHELHSSRLLPYTVLHIGNIKAQHTLFCTHSQKCGRSTIANGHAQQSV